MHQHQHKMTTHTTCHCCADTCEDTATDKQPTRQHPAPLRRCSATHTCMRCVLALRIGAQAPPSATCMRAPPMLCTAGLAQAPPSMPATQVCSCACRVHTHNSPTDWCCCAPRSAATRCRTQGRVHAAGQMTEVTQDATRGEWVVVPLRQRSCALLARPASMSPACCVAAGCRPERSVTNSTHPV
jgi:hypothetical protein